MAICPNCGEENPDRFRLCGFCGTPLADEAPKRETRKVVTVVFVDLKASTELGDALDPEAVRELVSRYFDEMRAVLESHGGTVEKYIGDAVMAVFGLPTIHEDDALRAVRAAIGMQTALESLNDELERRWGVRLANRTGVNTGEVISGDAASGQRLAIGDAVNVAARLEQAAPPLGILLGDSTFRLVRDAVVVEPVEPLELKGKPEPVPAHRLLALREHDGQAREEGTPLVGRERELALATAELERAVAERSCRVVTLVADAGLGKSRFTREFTRLVESRALVLSGRCLAYGRGITFWPLFEVVRRAAGIREEDTPAVAQSRLAELMPDDEVRERVASAVGLSDRQVPVEEVFWAVRKLFELLAQERPLVVVFEDVHWGETTFLDLIDRVAETVSDAPVLLLCAARPELDDLRPPLGGEAGAVHIALKPLSDEESTRVVEGLLGTGGLAPDVRDRIVNSAEGNPLFVEQLLSMLVEDGLVRQEGDRWVAAGDLEQLALPPTIQALLAARLEHLNEDERSVVETAAVVGYSFGEDALAEVAPDALRSRIPVLCATLVQKQFIRADASRLVGARTFRFNHILIRDAAYNGILKRSRAALHERFVVWAERVNRERERETEYEEILGYHLEQAHRYLGELGPLDEHGRGLGMRAGERLSSAGRRAFARGDMPAAANLLRRAADLYRADGDRRLELLPLLGEAFMEIGEFAWAQLQLDEAVETAAVQAHPSRQTDTMLTRLLVLHHITDDLEGWRAEVVREVERALPEAERDGDHALQAKAWRLLQFVHGSVCHWGDQVQATENALEHARLAGDARLEARLSAAYTIGLCDGPTPVSEAIARCEEILARGLADRQSEGMVLCSLAYLRAMRGDFERARPLYDRAHRLMHDVGGAVLAASTSLTSARVELLAGDPVRAAEELSRDYDALTAMGERYFRPLVAALLAQAIYLQGQDAEAAEIVAVAEELADEDDVEAQALWRRVRALLRAREGELAEAERLVREGYARLEPTDALVMQADALVDLADILIHTRPAEGRVALEDALERYERKGNAVSSARVRALLWELSREPAERSAS